MAEEHQEHDHEAGCDCGLCDGVAAVVLEEQEAAVADDNGKLDHLHLGQVPLPPEVRLHVRSKGCEGVVRVHDNVDEGVEQGAQGFMTARDEPKRMC